MKSRRKFLFDCSASVAVLALIPTTSFSTFHDGNHRSLDEISYDSLASQINTPFRVRLSSGRNVKLKLIKASLAPAAFVTPDGQVSGDDGNEKFSLIFSGPKEDLLAPAIHPFEHKQLGRFEMYVGPVGALDGNDIHYETVFNRLPMRPANPAVI